MNYKNAPLSEVHKQVFLCFIFGQITCGYALGIAGTAVTQAMEPLNLNSFWMGLLGAGTLIGLMGSVVVGNMADKIGRQKLFCTDMILFTVISLLQFAVSEPGFLFGLRICLGITIAIDYTVGSALLTEWFPSDQSARYQSFLIIFWTIGFVISYFAGILITGIGSGLWKWIFVSSAVPGGFTAIIRLGLRVPESPSWLAAAGKGQEANQLVHEYLGDEYAVAETVRAEVTKKVSWKELFGVKTRRNTLVGGIFYGCQVFPYFGVSIFIPILVENLNMNNPYASGTIYNVFMVLGAIVGVFLFERISRRAFLMITFYVSAVAAVGMILGQHAPTAVVIGFFSVFALFMSASVVAENPYPPELFNTRMRASGVGAVIAISRIGAALGTFLLPIIVDKAGVYTALTVCAAVLLAGGCFCQAYAPETSLKYKKILEESGLTGFSGGETGMPHIAIKMYPGRSEKMKQELAEKVRDFFASEMGANSRYFSVSIEEVEAERWKEEVVDKVLEKELYIKANF